MLGDKKVFVSSISTIWLANTTISLSPARREAILNLKTTVEINFIALYLIVSPDFYLLTLFKNGSPSRPCYKPYGARLTKIS